MTKEKVLLMFIGKTHSGKTTLASELKSEAKDLLVLEADPIAVFMKEKYPELRFNDDKEHTGEFKDISLKFRTFLLFMEFAMSLGKPIILSNSNMWSNGRKLVFDLCKKHNYKVIGLYLDLPEETLIQRIKMSDKSTDVLRTSKGFDELILKQRERMQPPDSSDFHKFFHIKSESQILEVRSEIMTLLKEWN